MTDQGFETALDKTPEDFATRLVYADWLEENNDMKKAGLMRWMVENKKYPWMLDRIKRNYEAEFDWWVWSNMSDYWDTIETMNCNFCVVDHKIFKAIPFHREIGRNDWIAYGWKYYSNRNDAETSLYKALFRLEILK